MCGISGFLGRFDKNLLDDMNRVLSHRGPDDSGTYWAGEKGIGLAHRRLSIIDLSEMGHQPMWDSTEQVVIVFNGEIYNYRELRTDLVSCGFAFKSNSDTEVLLNLYLRDGTEMLSALNGIFGFAIWDSRDESLFLARDCLGVKPLYYTTPKGGFLFSSELKALLQECSVQRDLNPEAVQYYLTYLWCPSPHTMLESVKKLEPGHAMKVKGGKIERLWRFYDLPYDQSISDLSPERAVEEVRESLWRAVERQMVADVPVGAFLSGGLDSSIVVGLARQMAQSSRLQCFTIRFAEDSARAEGMTSDFPYALRVAKHLDVDLHTIDVGPEMIHQLEKMIYHLDEPQADPAPLNTLFISKLARDRGIKVLLSGAGGDDIFAGYRRHFALMQERLWGWLPKPLRNGLSHAAQSIPVCRPALRRLSKVFQFAHLEGDERIGSYFFWTRPGVLDMLYGPFLKESGRCYPALSPLSQSLRGLPDAVHQLNRMLYLEGKYFLADHNLNYTDKMSMAAGIEVRVPFLDVDLVALAARLPVEFKQRGRIGKWVLKKVAESYLPKDVIYRPKTGFGAPLRHWLKNQLCSVVGDVLSEKSLAQRGLFDPAGVRNLIMMDRDCRIDGAYTIFSLVCIELWCRIFIDSKRPLSAPL